MSLSFLPVSEHQGRSVYSVAQLNRYVNQVFSRDGMLGGLWITGEISNFKHHSSGHLYFSLKDPDAAVNAVMFAGDARSLGFEPKDGMKVEVYGSVSVYEKTGSYQFYVRRMEEKGNGDLFAAFEALKKKLSEEGLFDSERKKPLPLFPRKIGVVTSPTGAALQDIIRVSKERYPGVELILYPAQVQGEGAAKTVCEGVKALDGIPDVDVIIVGRGGGSIEDLWCFNDEELARVIYAAHTPIVSAVGHEIDFTISDFVADMRAATPSNAAELCVPKVSEWLLRVQNASARSVRALKNKASGMESRLAVLNAKLQKKSPVAYLESLKQRIYLASDRLLDALDSAYEMRHNKLTLACQKLKLLNPSLNFEKGFCYVEGPDGKALKSIKGLKPKDRITVSVTDGKVTAQIESIQKD